MPAKLKALHIASGDLWAGAEVQLFTLLSQFAKGHDVQPFVALLNDGELAQRLRERHIPVTIVDETKLNGLQILGELRRLMAQLRPNTVHTHRTKENVLGSIANLLSTRAFCVRTCHGAPEHSPKGLRNVHKRMFMQIDRFCGRFLQHKIIAVSTTLGDDLTPLFGAARVVVIENGVNIEDLRLQVKPCGFRSTEPHRTHIGIVGRLEKVKRVDLFLDTAKLLLQRSPERKWHFHVVGDGSLRSKLEAQAQALGIAASVTFHGHRSDSATCLANLDALIMCSDHEGLPMTPLEAIALGTPVLAHDVGGLSTILSEGAGGLLISDHTPEGYAHGLMALLDCNKSEVLKRGNDRIATKFSSAQNADRTARLYLAAAASP
jgi:glycosyltransferase involved in cell wall biosynthesis